jgi:hypothetical protein
MTLDEYIFGHRIADAVLGDWLGRGGFDAYYEEIEPEIRDEILYEQRRLVAGLLNEYKTAILSQDAK